jgi:hypothetical protein
MSMKVWYMVQPNSCTDRDRHDSFRIRYISNHSTSCFFFGLMAGATRGLKKRI